MHEIDTLGIDTLGVAQDMLAGLDDARPILQRRTGPLTVQVTGRRGVGKSVVVALLDAGAEDGVAFVETSSVDLPADPEPMLDGDVVVYVVAGIPTAADVDAIARTDRALTVLTHVDALDDPTTTVARVEAAVRGPVLPLMATIALGREVDYAAVRAVASAMEDPTVLLTAEMFYDAHLPVEPEVRRALVDSVELWGVARLVETLRRTPTATDAELGALLRTACGLDHFWTEVRRTLRVAGAERDLRMHADLRSLGAFSPRARDIVEAYLASDDAVLTEMRASMVALGASDDDGEPLELAIAWRDRARHAADATERRLATAVSRGYLRMPAR